MKKRVIALAVILIVVGSVAFSTGESGPNDASAQAPSSTWSMAGANPQRTSWVSAEVPGHLSLKWYRPVEAYIDRKTQIVPVFLPGRNIHALFLATARGLYALNADTGETVWRYDTELPVAHSPTVVDGTVYFSGLDKKLHALNAETGTERWAYSGAQAGFYVNPLVVEGKVFAGNRDGYFYALDANTGRLLWRYPRLGQSPLGPIVLSAAYDGEEGQGVIYFASNDMYAYALDSATGSLIWRSADKLPGERIHSYWPVIYNNDTEDLVVFASSASYKTGTNPGTESAGDSDYVNGVQKNDVFAGMGGGELIGPTNDTGAWGWPSGITVMDASRILEYLEEPTLQERQADPNLRHIHKPWRRTTIYLRKSDGTEYSFDSDGDGLDEYPPNLFYGPKSGSQYPPIVNPNDGAIYQNNVVRYQPAIPRGRVMGWKPSRPQYLRWHGGGSANDEPQGISGGGNLIYRLLDSHHADSTTATGTLSVIWSYNTNGLWELIPNFSVMWRLLPGIHDLHGQYKGTSDSVNGIYHESGNRNAIIPYNGTVYVHKHNYVLAFGPGSAENRAVAPLTIAPVVDRVRTPPVVALKQRLATEIQKIVDARLLKPGYYNDGINPGRTQFYEGLDFYFTIPGDTLYTLARAYPHLSDNPTLQQQLKDYLEMFYQTYYQDTTVTQIGWDRGAQREWMEHPPEVLAAMQNNGDDLGPISLLSPTYPQFNLYALWKYAQIFPQQADPVYAIAKTKLIVPSEIVETGDGATTANHEYHPWRVNDFIAGYIGYLNLQQMSGDDTYRRTEVQDELNRLLEMRIRDFDKDNPWWDDRYWMYATKHNISRNFMWLVPELAESLRNDAQALAEVREALDEYNYVAPYWFVSAYEATMAEGLMAPLYDSPSNFQARAFILRQSREELFKYLDVPIFKVGDLFYIQNLIATIEAPSAGTTELNYKTYIPFTQLDFVHSDRITDLVNQGIQYRSGDFCRIGFWR